MAVICRCWWVGEEGSLGGSDGMAMSMIIEDFLLAYGSNRRFVGDIDGSLLVTPSIVDGRLL